MFGLNGQPNAMDASLRNRVESAQAGQQRPFSRKLSMGGIVPASQRVSDHDFTGSGSKHGTAFCGNIVNFSARTLLPPSNSLVFATILVPTKLQFGSSRKAVQR